MYSFVLIEKRKGGNAKEKRIVVIGGLVCKRGERTRGREIDKRLEFYFLLFLSFFFLFLFSRGREKKSKVKVRREEKKNICFKLSQSQSQSQP